MNWADWAIIGIFSLSCLIGFTRGFVREALSLVIWITALLIARTFSDQLEVFLIDLIKTPSIRSMTAFAILFIATLLLGAMLGYLIGALIRATGLSGTDRLLGMVFGAARAFIIVMVLLIFLPDFAPVNDDPWWTESQFIPHFLNCEDWVTAAYNDISRMLSALFNKAESSQSL